MALFGGPPCKGFSFSNLRTRSPQNPDNWLYLEFLRFARAWNPEWLVIENVQGLQNTTKGLFFREILSSIQGLGYTPTQGLLNAMYFGVPQDRTRLLIVAARGSYSFIFPSPTTRRPITVSEAILDLPILDPGASQDYLPYSSPPHSRYAEAMRSEASGCFGHVVSRNNALVLERYRHIREGQNWQAIPAHLLANYSDSSRCHTGIYRRLALDKPSSVIGNFRKNMLIHPTQDRGLSIREAARLQSFPDSYRFSGSIGFQQEQVGNAVPPLLAKAVFAAILSQEPLRAQTERG